MFTALTFLFVLVSVVSVIALIIGLIKPGKIIRFGKVKTRKRVLLILLPTFFISFILTGVFADKAMTPEERVAVDKKRAEEKLLKEKQAQEKITKEKEAKEKKEQEKVTNAKEKEEQEIKAKEEKKVAEEKRKQEEEQKKAEKLEKEKTIKEKGFEDKVKEVASSEKTPTEKFDEISKYAHDYKPTKDEVNTFGAEIIKEYTNKTYIKDVSNHEYMLSNIFKSEVVERNASEKPLKDFAFDFWQNSKYNYRGIENTTSHMTLENERQMDKSLRKMNK